MDKEYYTRASRKPLIGFACKRWHFVNLVLHAVKNYVVLDHFFQIIACDSDT